MAHESSSPRGFWLVKSEPDCYSIDDLKRDKRTAWTGVRNYQARNFMRDGMKIGDLVLYHHSGSEPPGIVGIARVCSAPHADETAQDPKDDHYDPKSTRDDPIWMCVDIEFVRKFDDILSMAELKAHKSLASMLVLQRGQRLSVMPVDETHFRIVEQMAEKSARSAASTGR